MMWEEIITMHEDSLIHEYRLNSYVRSLGSSLNKGLLCSDIFGEVNI